jgi:hypothetical protein
MTVAYLSHLEESGVEQRPYDAQTCAGRCVGGPYDGQCVVKLSVKFEVFKGGGGCWYSDFSDFEAKLLGEYWFDAEYDRCWHWAEAAKKIRALRALDLVE